MPDRGARPAAKADARPARRQRPSRTPFRHTATGRTARRPAFDLNADERHERFTLIEFVWDIASGVQPVILAERKLLH